MIKINYPSNLRKLKSDYSNLILNSGSLDIQTIDKYLQKIRYNNVSLNFDTILTLPIDELVIVGEKINQGLNFFDKQKLRKEFKDKYGILQNKLADFFMNDSNIGLESCHYCNIDFVNSFIDLVDYKNGTEFLNKAKKRELMLLSDVGTKKADSIISKRKKNKFNDIKEASELNQKAKKQLNVMKFRNTHNNFTLDHVMPKSKYFFCSLSLFNLVPSCYVCNSKMKGSTDFQNLSDLKWLSPSSEKFSVNKDVKFKILFNGKLNSLKSEKDFQLVAHKIRRKDAMDEYLDLFKIEGRYVYHKKEVPKLIRKKIDYSESMLREISKKTGYSISKVREDIFGEELYDNSYSSRPLTKLKKDIAENIKIPEVKK